MFRVMIFLVFLSLIQHLVKLGKLFDRTTQPPLANLNCALHILNPQVETLSLGTMKCAVFAFQKCTLHNRSAHS